MTEFEKNILIRGLNTELTRLEMQKKAILDSISRYTGQSFSTDVLRTGQVAVQKDYEDENEIRSGKRNSNVRSRMLEFLKTAVKGHSAPEIANAIGGSQMTKARTKARATFYSTVNSTCYYFFNKEIVTRERKNGVYEYKLNQ